MSASSPVAKSAIVVLLFPLLSCGGGKAVQPADPTYKQASGASDPTAICHDVHAEGTPLIVDWRPEDRGDLEAAMKQGVAFVHYDCNAIRLLPDCHAAGKYAFVGITKKEQLISLANADEAKANLPMSGGKIGASLGSSTSLDIGLVMVGKRATVAPGVEQAELSGKCDGVTHFVRSATVGAFAMQTDTAGSVKAVADLFGVGAGGGSSSAKQTMSRDGEPGACASADPDGDKPPSQCGALLRVQLVAIGEKAAATNDVSCPEDTVPVNGKCTAQADDAALKCINGGDLASCKKSCDANNPYGCAGLVTAAMNAKSPQWGVVAPLVKKTCDLGVSIFCADYSYFLLNGLGIPADPDAGKKLASSTCAAGEGQGCQALAQALANGALGTPDFPTSVSFYARGCQLGEHTSCNKAADMFLKGRPGIQADPIKAAAFWSLSCDADDGEACANVAQLIEKEGKGQKDARPEALKFYRRGCEKNFAPACKGEARLAGKT